MKIGSQRFYLAAWAALYAVLAIGCTEDNKASDETGGTGGTQDTAGTTAGLGGAAGQSGAAGSTAGSGAAGTSGSSGSGASDSGIVSTTPTGKSLSALKKVTSCSDVLSQIKKRITQQAEETLDANLKQILSDMQNGSFCRMYAMEDMAGGAAGSGGATTPPSNTTGATAYSTTNTQVVGVDEADFVKNDDNYIYLVADGKLQIMDAWPAAQTHLISSTTITNRGTPNKLYVENNRAVVYSSLEYIDQGTSDLYGGMYMPTVSYSGYQQECTYGYECDFSGDGHKLLISTYDITDKTNPVLLRETELSGSYLNSRRIGNIVHTVATFPEIAVPGLVYWPKELETYYSSCYSSTDFPYTEQEVRDMFADLKDANQEAVDKSTITDFLPGIKDTRLSGATPIVEEGLLNSCDNFYVSQEGDGRGFLALVSFDMSALGALNATTVVGKPGAVYASNEALYVAVRHYSTMMTNWYFDDSTTNNEATTVHKFTLSPDSIETVYAGSGVATGRILNQFSMDEQDGYLRIATSMGQVPDPNVHSTISVLAEQGGDLEVVGVLDDIAPTEDIRSVRFNGDVGFVVTFKKTDPLFVIDLSDPTKPAIKGELKVPGFATYIHLMDATHLITIGYDADDMGTYAWFQGLQLRVLDVNKLDAPTVVSEITIGTRGSSSDAATDHLAFNYFPERNLLALPMTLCEGGPGGGTYGDIMTFSGLQVYRVTVADGFTLLGGVPHKTPETEDTYNQYYGAGCSNWWTDSNTTVKRSIFMSSDTEDFVYSIALDAMKVANLKNLGNPLVSVALTAN
jgi:hypothetical protein